MTSRRHSTLSISLLVTAAALALGACSKTDDRTAGQKLDATIAKTEQQADAAKAEIKQDMAQTSADAKAAAAKAGTAIEQAADKAGTAMGNASIQIGDKVADAAITAGVNAELARDPGLSALRINVDTSAGRVLLMGSAPDTAARDRATRLAQAVKGVVSVDNRLDVRG